MTAHIELPDHEVVEIGKPKSVFQRWSVRSVLTLMLFVAGAGCFIALSSLLVPREIPPLARVAMLPHSATLDKHHIDKRLLLIGDVHGMSKELHKLLRKVNYNRYQDTIVFLGDMVTKGYDSLGVIDFAIDHGAYCVRGNHEDELMTLYAHEHQLQAPRTYPPHASQSTLVAGQKPSPTLEAQVGPVLNRDESVPTAMGLGVKDAKCDLPLVKKLKKRHIDYLAACPAILKLGQVSRRGIEAVAVHGGLLWSEHSLEDQDIVDVLRVRSIVPPDYTHGSENPDDGEPWFNRWNEEQKTRNKSERYEVFYGHDASKGLQLKRYSKGLDTKCQRGGKLSAYVVRVTHKGSYHEKLVQIEC